MALRSGGRGKGQREVAPFRPHTLDWGVVTAPNPGVRPSQAGGGAGGGGGFAVEELVLRCRRTGGRGSDLAKKLGVDGKSGRWGRGWGM